MLLDQNQLTALPVGILALTGLQKLGLNQNQLTELPEGISALTGLQLLGLGQNQLTALPEVISALAGLQQLAHIQNQLTALPEGISTLTGLQVLGLAGNDFKILTRKISNLTCLTQLHIDEVQSIRFSGILQPIVDRGVVNTHALVADGTDRGKRLAMLDARRLQGVVHATGEDEATCLGVLKRCGGDRAAAIAAIKSSATATSPPTPALERSISETMRDMGLQTTSPPALPRCGRFVAQGQRQRIAVVAGSTRAKARNAARKGREGADRRPVWQLRQRHVGAAALRTLHGIISVAAGQLKPDLG